jgi:polyisoprenoid-binding protein YceI
MKKLLLLALLAAVSAGAQQVAYEIKPAEGSRFALEVYKTGFLRGKKHLFLFDKYQGNLAYDGRAPEKSAVDLTIETASIVIKDDWVSASQSKDIYDHAIGKEMLEVARYPQIRFVSRQVTGGADQFNVAGDLTIRGVAKPVAVNVTVKVQPGLSLSLAGKAEIKLKDYNLKPPSAALGMIGTKNEMSVDFLLTASPKR